MSPSAPPPPELSRPFAPSRLTAQALEVVVCPEPDERAAIARRLHILGLARLEVRFSLRRLPAGIVEADGTLTAEVTQQCVVSLEPVEQSVGEQFTVRFVPAGTEDDVLDPDAIDEIPYEADRIDLGEAAVEQLALALDPFPRKPGSSLPPGGESASIHPFASLRDRRNAH